MEHLERNKNSAGLKPADIVLILFRRKWLILAFSVLGILGSALYYFLVPAVYSSEAKLFIRYVLERKLPAATGSETQIRQPDASGKNIVASEVEILTSYDLALEVAEKVGPQKIVSGQPGTPATKEDAAILIRNNLKIDVPRNSDVLRITFQHTDRSIVQPVLRELIERYKKKHDEIHRTSGVFDEALSRQTDQLRSKVDSTEKSLNEQKSKVGILSLEDARKAYAEELSRVRQEIHNTEAEYAEKDAALASFKQTSGASSTNSTATNTAPVPPEKTSEYKRVLGSLDSLRKMEQDRLRQFAPKSDYVKDIQSQIAESEKIQVQLETEYPSLASSVPQSLRTSGNGSQEFNPTLESLHIAALQAKYSTLTNLEYKLTSEINKLRDAEPNLLSLQRKKEIEEDQYKHFLTSLEQARFDMEIDAGRLPNIGEAQTPSPAFRESRKTLKAVAGLIAAGLALGIGLAFALELHFNPSVRTAGELERRLKTQVLISIPALGANGSVKKRRLSLPSGESASGGENGQTQPASTSQVIAWQPGHRLQVYYEGLRDRIMTWFDTRNLTRKPKLVAVTSCENGAGVSSIAAGLAATLSETGDGRVLLVDMNVGQGAAHSFYKGRPGCGLDEALEDGKRDDAQVNENLFVVAEGTSNRDKLPSVLPRRFTSLVPKLKASDFDFIIFDMPPVSPITMTPRLSTYMDLVLLVVQAEKTSPHALKQANELLTQAKANVGAVLNKTKSHGPKWIGLPS